MLGASCLRGANFLDEKAQAAQNYVEWITKYTDGTVLTTLNAALSEVFDRMPHQLRQRFPGVTDPTRLKTQHDRRAADLLARQPLFAHGRDLLEEYRGFHRRWCAFQESRGLLRHDAEAGGCRVTRRLAWRGVLNYLNPLADNFSLRRFLPAICVGTGLPAMALWITGDHARLALLAQAAGLPASWAALGLLLAATTIAGAVVGWLFEGKSFVWGLLLGYLPVRLLGGLAGTGIASVLWLGFVADRISWLRSMFGLVA